MKVTEVSNAKHLKPQKLSARQTPHVTIETNTDCNIRCKFCYAIEHPITKSLDEIKGEIDLACERRNLDAISLLGGEPTLHPDILDVVRYVKAKGLVCQLLTNGVRFLFDHDRQLYADLVEAGVDRFLVHIDSGQDHVHADLNEARHATFAMLDELEVWYGLSMTLYEGEEEELPQIMKEFSRHRFFDGVLVTLAFDFARAFSNEEKRRFEPDFLKVANAMEAQLGVEPAAYIPSNLDDDEVCWLMYFYWYNVETGETFGLSPELNRAMKLLYRTVSGHEFFADTMNRKTLGLQLAASGAAEVVLHPRRAGEFAQLLKRAHGSENLRFHYVVIQQAPRLDDVHGKVQFCWQCPDATVRNGRLTPVCMAGRLDPLGGHESTAPREVIEEVYRHLEEPLPE